MPKRKYDDVLSDEKSWSEELNKGAKKNSLDSDEEDDENKAEIYNVMDEEEIEGAEYGPTDENIGFTAFNMKEELEEGHFDKEGHYLWKKEKEVRDHWLDNIDWVQVKPTTVENKNFENEERGLADSDSEEESNTTFNPIDLYKKIFEYLKPGESVSKALCRFGKGKTRISSSERWKRKKAGLSETDENSEKITKLTELANELLTRTGNMNIYQETYKDIEGKINLSNKRSHPSKQEAELDMYSDDFDRIEKEKLESNQTKDVTNTSDEKDQVISDNNVEWEFKWDSSDNAEVNGPFSSEKMLTWHKEEYFKKGAWVRRVGQNGPFYSIHRVDFELYM